MLQRIQTVYLFLAFICSILILFFPIYSLSVTEATSGVEKLMTFGAYGIQGESPKTIPLYLIFVLTGMLSLTAIFLYKNRKKQLLITRLNLLLQMLIAIAFLVVSIFGHDYIAGRLNTDGIDIDKIEFQMTYGIAYYLLFLGIPFLLLAIRGIRKDEALLKSLDRLR